jgi:hypothetical protein
MKRPMLRTIAVLSAFCAALAGADKDLDSVIARRNYWAFQAPVRPLAPRTIDGFIRDALAAKGLRLSPPAGREQLLRRVTLDLTGLPPTPGEIDLFLADRAPGAYERAVDRLLASPHYGERWALRWLDVVRYADTNGYELDAERPHAWRYRDYVTRAFNADKPFDRFIREQIAGDELFPGDRDALIATGFHRAGPIHLVGGVKDEEADRQEVLTEMAGAIGPIFLGLTVGCARCHNHKFDPILQSDYYRLQAIFASAEAKDAPLYSEGEKTAHEAEMKAYEARLAPIKKELAEIEKPYMADLTAKRREKVERRFLEALDTPAEKRTQAQAALAKDAEKQIKPMWDELVGALSTADREKRAALRARMHAIELTKPLPLPAAFATVSGSKAPETHILRVGDVKHKMGRVEPGLPAVFETNGIETPATPSGRRSALANWLASPKHPLTARVMVNRIWQFRMGTGIVRTPNDFGVLGERPSNQKLLDWLATEFAARNWSVKAIDRAIVLSDVYRQSAAGSPAAAKVDPDNRLYWRMNRKRMEAETIRDNALAASGSLNARMGGPPVRVPIEQEVYDLIFTEGERDGLWPVLPDKSEHARRSLYLLNKRSVRLPMMAAFDQPDTMTSCPLRQTSTHALQALALFNSDFMREQSAAFAARLERECRGDAGCEVRRAYRLALGRLPRPAESAMGAKFLRAAGALPDFCLALLNRNEFVYVP